MKILVLIVLLNGTGDIEKGMMIGVADTVTTCQQTAAKAIDETKVQIPSGLVPVPLCIDLEPLVESFKHPKK